MSKEYVYSLDGESDWCDNMEDVMFSYEDIVEIHRGEKVKLNLLSYVSTEDILDSIANNIYSDNGDWADAFVEDMNTISNDKSISEEFEKIICDFIEKQVGEIPFYHVKDVELINVEKGEVVVYLNYEEVSGKIAISEFLSKDKKVSLMLYGSEFFLGYDENEYLHLENDKLRSLLLEENYITRPDWRVYEG